MASAANHTMTPTCSTPTRAEMRRRSSVGATISYLRTSLPSPPSRTPAFDDTRKRLDDSKRHDPDERVAQRLCRQRLPRRRKHSNIQPVIQPHEHGSMEDRRRDEDDQTRQGGGHDELLPERTGQKPDDGLGEPADADHTARQRVLNQARDAAGEHPPDRTNRQCHSDHRHQDEIDGRGAPDHESRERGLQRERQRDGDENADGFHRSPSSAGSGAASGTFSTTSTASSVANSTAGFTRIFHSPPSRSVDCISPTGKPLG